MECALSCSAGIGETMIVKRFATGAMRARFRPQLLHQMGLRTDASGDDAAGFFPACSYDS